MAGNNEDRSIDNPLAGLHEWEEGLLQRYPAPQAGDQSLGIPLSSREKPGFRNYESAARPSVRDFYRLNHTQQTLEFARRKRDEYLTLDRRRMGIWEALEYLNTLVDDSDPDTDLAQIEHCLQTAEAIRADGHPRWFILTGLIHDLGKILCLFGEPQWAVVGDTFPVGCRFSEAIVFHEFFAGNPDTHDPSLQTPCGIYSEHCGLGQVLLSWGHDEYLYHVVKDHLPEPALAMIRYHSCYPIHREEAYGHLMNDGDRELLGWVRRFNPYDLYTKRDTRPDVTALRPYYEELIDEFFPRELAW
jgi:inositol oxygenase